MIIFKAMWMKTNVFKELFIYLFLNVIKIFFRLQELPQYKEVYSNNFSPFSIDCS